MADSSQPNTGSGTVLWRRIARRTRAGSPEQGFAGPGHTAVEVFNSSALARTDPFVMLMDDLIDFAPGRPIGAAHPHAGLETVTLILEGSLNDRDEGLLRQGDMAWMSAGRGIIHNESVVGTGRARILQLWVALPARVRFDAPDLKVIRLESLPTLRAAGVEARLYSGRTGHLVSTTRNRLPTTVIDFHMSAGASFDQVLPGNQAGLVYVIEGSLEVGGPALVRSDVGWIDRSPHEAAPLHLQAGPAGARVILYAAQPLDAPIVHQGPFVAGSHDELSGFFSDYRAGRFQRLSTLRRSIDA